MTYLIVTDTYVRTPVPHSEPHTNALGNINYTPTLVVTQQSSNTLSLLSSRIYIGKFDSLKIQDSVLLGYNNKQLKDVLGGQ